MKLTVGKLKELLNDPRITDDMIVLPEVYGHTHYEDLFVTVKRRTWHPETGYLQIGSSYKDTNWPNNPTSENLIFGYERIEPYGIDYATANLASRPTAADIKHSEDMSDKYRVMYAKADEARERQERSDHKLKERIL